MQNALTPDAALRQQELLCVMTFQKMEWVTMDDVDTKYLENSENVDEAENDFSIPIIDIDEIEPIWSDPVVLCFFFCLIY